MTTTIEWFLKWIVIWMIVTSLIIIAINTKERTDIIVSYACEHWKIGSLYIENPVLKSLALQVSTQAVPWTKCVITNIY